MKKIFTFICCIISVFANAQPVTYISFDNADTIYQQVIEVDTVNYHHNLWQIGSPHKTIFNSAASVPNVIITDTLNPYSANDTSVFILKIPLRSPLYVGTTTWGPLYMFNFAYRLNIDSNAIALLEMSEDSGAHWVNVRDTLPYNYNGSAPDTNLFRTSTTGWTYFHLDRSFHFIDSGTVWFRFTFMTNSAATGREGWMIDNISAVYYFEGVNTIQNNNLVSVYPNPSKGNLYIYCNKEIHVPIAITIYNLNGQQVYTAADLSPNKYLNLNLPGGLYTLRYSAGNEYCIKKLVIED